MKLTAGFVLETFVFCASILFPVIRSQSVPYNFSPFLNTGYIDELTLDSTDDPLSGGTLTIDGLKYTIPKNTLVTLPSIAVAWSELFDTDGTTPLLPQFGTISWQGQVYGNRVDDDLIAGLVYISQDFGNIIQGFINAIDFETGHFRVGGTFDDPQSGIECVLNDPLGRFGKNYTDWPIWTVDPDNPSVRSPTGFPLCIPRSEDDPECPNSQRPNGETKIEFGAPPVAEGEPDPFKMVPIIVGDYVTISAVNVGNDLYAVYALDANLGIYTAPGTQPAYVTVEEARYAIYAQLDNEEDGEVRAVAFTTDPSVNMQWYAIDVNPCTGEETERNLLLVKPEIDDPAGKTVIRGRKSNFNPGTREMGFRLSSGTVEGPGGIIAGQFVQPIMNDMFIMPELIVFGDDMPQNPFDKMDYLAKGSGPFVPGNLLADPPEDTIIVGKLDPWPGKAIAAGPTCDVAAASAGLQKKIAGNSTSTAPTFFPSESAVPSFDENASVEELDAAAAGSALAARATAVAAGALLKPRADIVTIQSATYDKGGGVTHLQIQAATNDANATLFFRSDGKNPINNSTMSPVGVGSGFWSFTIDVKDRPDTAFVSSSHGGSTSAPFTADNGAEQD